MIRLCGTNLSCGSLLQHQLSYTRVLGVAVTDIEEDDDDKASADDDDDDDDPDSVDSEQDGASKNLFESAKSKFHTQGTKIPLVLPSWLVVFDAGLVDILISVTQFSYLYHTLLKQD